MTMNSPPSHHTGTMPSHEEADRRVRFLPRTQIKVIKTLDEISDEEIAAVWRLEHEDRQTQRGLVESIKAMRRAGRHVENGDTISTRGLEHLLSTAHTEQHSANKDAVKDAVLEEQERQWSKSIEDTEKIANASARASQWALDCALTRAEEDAAHVRRGFRNNLGDRSKDKYQSMLEEVRNLQGDYKLSSQRSEPSKPCLKNRSVDESTDRISLRCREHEGKTQSSAPSTAPVDLLVFLRQAYIISTEGGYDVKDVGS